MKKYFCGLTILSVILTLLSCGTAKAPQASNSEMQNPYGQEVFKTPSEKLAEQQPGKRASGKGVSFSESAARELAEMDARAQMSRSLDAAIVSASKRIGFDITQYAGGDGEGMTNTDGGQQQNTLAKSISSNIIANTTVINTDKYYGKDRKYTIFVCVEYNGSVQQMAQQAVQQIKQRISDSDRAKIQQENEKFQQEIEQELNYK